MNQLLNNINKKQWLVDGPWATMIIFIILNIMAMVFYKGGTLHNQNSIGYSFFNNFLSDLGRVVSHSGNINFHASLCFNMAMLIAGFSLSMFFYMIPTLFTKHKNPIYLLSIIASIFGILGSFSMIGVGFTPSDLFFSAHVLFAHWLFRFFVIAAFLIAITIYKSPDFNNKYAVGYIVFALVIFSYVLFNEFGPLPYKDSWSLYIQVVLQKAILLCFFIAVIIQSKGIKQILEHNEQ